MISVSVIVPVYNTEKYVGKTIESIMAQTYSNLEIILVDDGSTDSSGQICDECARKDDRIKVVHQDNAGLKMARLAGLAVASGDYVAFSDSDDWVETDYIERLVKAGTECDADITTGAYVNDKDGQVTCIFEVGEQQKFDSQTALSQMFSAKYFNWSMCNKLYKRELFDGIDAGPDPHESYGEDTYFDYRLFRKAKSVCYTPSLAYHYVIRDDSMMRISFSKRKFIYIRQWTEIYDDCINRGDEKIADKVKAILLDSGISFVIQGFETYGRGDAETLQALSLIKTRIKEEPVNHPSYKHYIWFLRTDEEQEAFLSERKHLLDKYVTETAKIYLYGAGRIAGEVATFLEENGVDYSVVVSETKGGEVFRDKSVWGFKDVSIGKNDVIILGLSEKNKGQVEALVDGYTVLDFGKYSYYY